MRWLLINSCDRARLMVTMISQTGEIQERVSSDVYASVLSELYTLIKPEELSQLQGIALVYGPGSFSAIRGGVLVANLLSRLYHIPLYGFTKDEAMDLIDIRRKLMSGEVQQSEYISPLYDAEPNITIKKQKIENGK